jgi:transposase
VRLLRSYRFDLVHALARQKADALAVLYLKASEYGQLKPFPKLFGAASRAVLQEVACLEAIADLPFDELVEWLDLPGKRRFADPQATAGTLQQVAGDTYALPDALVQPIQHILSFCLQHVTVLEGQIKRLDSAIDEQMATIAHALETIPGIGRVFAGAIVAELGEIARFEYDQAKLAKVAAFKWRKHQSAEFTAEETHLTGTGNRYLGY